MRTRLPETLSSPVLDFLVHTARKFRPQGAELLLFGSFTQGRSRPNSDLDIAIRWTGAPDSSIRRQIGDQLDRAPTIRSIDLVDLQDASQELLNEVDSTAVALADL